MQKDPVSPDRDRLRQLIVELAVVQPPGRRPMPAADYLRGSDADDLRRDVETRVREKPLQSVLVAVAAGWLVGKIVR